MENFVENKDLEKFNGNTPTFVEIGEFEDADEELLPIAKYIMQTTVHNADIIPDRIKFLYTNKPKKDGGRFIITSLSLRSPIEKMISDDYDFIITVFYEVWKDLQGEQKVILLDKALCGIDMGSMDSPKIKKKSPDSKEYIDNMNHFTPRKVMEVSEMVHLTCQRIMEEKAEEKQKNKN